MAFDIYETITNKIIEKMESGNFTWSKPWNDLNHCAFNRITKKPYSLLNQLLLGVDGEYATFKQWSELGATVKKGSKAKMVVFWTFIEKKTDKKDNDGNFIVKSIPFLKYYNVFHISDVEGIDPLPETELNNNDIISDCETVANEYLQREHISLKHSENNAYYSPTMDYINVPELKAHKTSNDYYSTLFHEMVHSTGHEKRLNRFENDSYFGNESYSKEELVAEIGSATLLTMTGANTENTFINSVAYLQSWIKVLKNDKHFIVSASSKAENAIKYILNKD